jgi:glutathione-regulated potassium-efflux system ancillary protein KefG
MPNFASSPVAPSVLVLFAHPDPDASLANRILSQAAQHLPHVTFHDLYATYPDFFIDVAYEQALLSRHQVIVFQYPLYMYSCPALLKEWMDCVLGKDYAYGAGRALQGKIWRSVITTGGSKAAFSKQGYNGCTLSEILAPFRLTAALCQMHWCEPFVIYWARRISDSERLYHAECYRDWLISLMPQGE